MPDIFTGFYDVFFDIYFHFVFYKIPLKTSKIIQFLLRNHQKISRLFSIIANVHEKKARISKFMVLKTLKSLILKDIRENKEIIEKKPIKLIKTDEIAKKDSSFHISLDKFKDSLAMSPISLNKTQEKIAKSPLLIKPINRNLFSEKFRNREEENTNTINRKALFPNNLKESANLFEKTNDESQNLNRSTLI